MKVRETSAPQGRAQLIYTRVIEIPEGDPVPEGAELVASDTATHDWEETNA